MSNIIDDSTFRVYVFNASDDEPSVRKASALKLIAHDTEQRNRIEQLEKALELACQRFEHMYYQFYTTPNKHDKEYFLKEVGNGILQNNKAR